MASLKARIKRHNLIKKEPWEIGAPVIDPQNYSISIIRCLNFYNVEVDIKLKQTWAIKHWKDQGKDTTNFSLVGPGFFNQAGALAYMLKIGAPIQSDHIKYIDDTYDMIKKKAEIAKKEKDEEEKKQQESGTKIKSAQEKMEENTIRVMSEIDGEFDNLILNGTSFNIKKWFIQQRLNGPASMKVHDFYTKQLNELNSVFNGEADKDLIEGYSCYSKRQIRQMRDFMQEVISACQTNKVLKIRAPKIAKEKPPAVLAAKMKYQPELAEFKIKSVHPSKIVGASEVWLYSTQYRRIYHYKVMDGMKLSVKGTVILNWDPEKSSCKIVRKPEIQVPDFHKSTQKNQAISYDAIKAVATKVNGRLNENHVILAVY